MSSPRALDFSCAEELEGIFAPGAFMGHLTADKQGYLALRQARSPTQTTLAAHSATPRGMNSGMKMTRVSKTSLLNWLDLKIILFRNRKLEVFSAAI